MNSINEIEINKFFERLKNAKHGAAVDFVKPAVFATLDKWYAHVFGNDFKTDDGWVRGHRFLCFANDPKHFLWDNVVPEAAIEFVKLQGNKATIKFKRGNTEYKVQLDLSEHK